MNVNEIISPTPVTLRKRRFVGCRRSETGSRGADEEVDGEVRGRRRPSRNWKRCQLPNVKCFWLQCFMFQVHKLKLEAVYTSDIPFFDFDSQMDPWTVARQADDSHFLINLDKVISIFLG